jgi:hypothetical protein
LGKREFWDNRYRSDEEILNDEIGELCRTVKKLKITKPKKNKKEVKIVANGEEIGNVDFDGKGEVFPLDDRNTVILKMHQNSINDILMMSYHPKPKEEKSKRKNEKWIFGFYGENRIRKIKSYPKANKLINYNQETQEIFELSQFMAIGQKFSGNSFIDIQAFKLVEGEIKARKHFQIEIGADLMKIKAMRKNYWKGSSLAVIGILLSDGSFELLNIDLAKLAPAKGSVIEVEKSSFEKSDEIFSCFDFISSTKFLIGTQKGTILLCKKVEQKFKIINSYNRYNNFMVTNISIMPQSFLEDPKNPNKKKSKEILFCYSTADGFIKIQSTEEDYPLYHYQSISVIFPYKFFLENYSLFALGL